MKNYIQYVTLSILLIGAHLGCDHQSEADRVIKGDHAILYQELLKLEYAIHKDDEESARKYAISIDHLLKKSYSMFCVSECAEIDGARLTNHLVIDAINVGAKEQRLNDLRLLKGMIVRLETDEDIDPYLAFLWRYEEEMYEVTKVAMDPMLALYEWNEFEEMAECMFTAWQPVEMHYPSPEILDNNSVKYKNQTVHKIYLETAMNQFRIAIESGDYVGYPLCETAEAVRDAYVKYISTFISEPLDNNTFLAKL